MLAVFVAVLAEQKAVERRMEVLERRDLEGYPVTLGSWGGKPVAVCRTGLGERRGEEAAQAVLAEYSPAAVVSARVASSFSDDVRSGDLVLCEKLYLYRSDAQVEEPPVTADDRLLTLGQQAARGAGLTYRLGNALTFAAPTAEMDRERLPREYSLAVVSAEGHSLAEAATARETPFLAVRAALGRSCERIPESLSLLRERGDVSYWRLLGRLRHPGQVPGILALATSVRRASRRLSAFMRGFLREWSLEP